MKNYFKKPVLLLGSLAAVVGLGFVSSESNEVKAQGDSIYCEWVDLPWDPNVDGCKIPPFIHYCICEGC